MQILLRLFLCLFLCFPIFAGDDVLKLLPDSVADFLKISEEKKQAFLADFDLLQDNDPLLVLVNKEVHLDGSYEPFDLVDVTSMYPTNKKLIFLRNLILSDLNDLFAASRKDSVELVIISAYRSYNTQKYVFSKWEKALGREEALKVSALPGASQHQLGTTVDFNSLEFSFEFTSAGKWLAANSYKYGFIMSYPKGQEELTGYSFEPWHYRYIGKHAAFIVFHYFDNNLELFLRFYRAVQEQAKKEDVKSSKK